MSTRLGNYAWVDPHKKHNCKEFREANLCGVEIIIWSYSGNASVNLEIAENSMTSLPITYCPFCGKKLSKK